jgi:hypothetical protein
MKLARIEHKRCGEYRATTHVWIPDEMGSEELGRLAHEARNAMLKAEDDFANSPDAPKHPGWAPAYEKFPNKTAAEIKSEHDALVATYKAWEARKNAAKRTFAETLKATSGGAVKTFYGYEEWPGIEAEISWGHRHGQIFDVSPTDPSAKDINAPKSEDEDTEL